MPQTKSKPSEIAGEAKRLYIPHIIQTCPQFPARSMAYPDTTKMRLPSNAGTRRKLRIAIIEGDPVDVALDWHDSNCRDTPTGSTAKSNIAGASIPVVCMANEKRAGGEWESSTMAPEECLCRRSTLVQALTNPSAASNSGPHYPMRTTSGIYSPSVGKPFPSKCSQTVSLSHSSCFPRRTRQGILCLEGIQVLACHFCSANSSAQTGRYRSQVLLRARTRSDERENERYHENRSGETTPRPRHGRLWGGIWFQKPCCSSRTNVERNPIRRTGISRGVFQHCLCY